MSKAMKVSTLSINPASEPTHIMEMVRRHGELFREMDRLYALGGDAAADGDGYQAASQEATDLENRIVATRAKSRADITAKQRFIRDTAFISGDGCDTGDLHTLVEMILQLDAEAVSASIAPEPEAVGAAAKHRRQRDVERVAAAH